MVRASPGVYENSKHSWEYMRTVRASSGVSENSKSIAWSI